VIVSNSGMVAARPKANSAMMLAIQAYEVPKNTAGKIAAVKMQPARTMPSVELVRSASQPMMGGANTRTTRKMPISSPISAGEKPRCSRYGAQKGSTTPSPAKNRK